jgi:hypothetical protein
MSPLDRAARISVARGCGFACLATMTVAIGLSSSPALALKTAGALLFLAACVLIHKCERAGVTPYQHTEIWLMLGDDERPSPAERQTLIAGARRQALAYFARLTTLFAVLLTGVGVTLGFAGSA